MPFYEYKNHKIGKDSLKPDFIEFPLPLDMDNGKLWFSKNGVWNASGDPAAGTNAAYTSITGEYFASVGTGASGGGFTCHFNFGQRPFTYTPPSGFKSLNTFNLP